MSDRNPYSAAALWHQGYREQLNAHHDESKRIAKKNAMRVPTLEATREAYAADEIDHVDLERMIDAALTGTRVEIPKRMTHRLNQQTDMALAIIKASRKRGISSKGARQILLAAQAERGYPKRTT